LPDETVAAVVLLLIHVPPPVTSDNVIVFPVHTDAEDGEMAAGLEITVTIFVATQPEVPDPSV
jgi:hypothetical protein